MPNGGPPSRASPSPSTSVAPCATTWAGRSGPEADISEIFGLFSSGGSDIAKHKDRYVGEAVEAEYLRKTGRRKRGVAGH